MIESYKKVLEQIKEYDTPIDLSTMNQDIFLYSVKRYKEKIHEQIHVENNSIALREPFADLYESLFNITIVCLNMLSLLTAKSKQEITEENELLFCRKNEDYGNSFEDFGLTAIIIRMNDKMNRIITLLEKKREGNVKDERIEDTISDLYNYGVIGLMYKNKVDLKNK